MQSSDTTAGIRTHTGSPPKMIRESPIHTDSPDDMTCAERESAPPTRSRVPHGVLFPVSQFMSITPSFGRAGSKNTEMPEIIAMTESVAHGSSNITGTTIQDKAVPRKMISIIISPVVILPSERRSSAKSFFPPGRPSTSGRHNTLVIQNDPRNIKPAAGGIPNIIDVTEVI